ncbi:MAG TPA: FAD:protein FMN transferase, partial [Woeseiaceae bacterium]
ERYAHVLDPRTGYPARDTSSVTVIHTDPVLADAAATALLVAGNAEFDEACERLGIDHALLISDRGDLRLTPQMRDRVHWRE